MDKFNNHILAKDVQNILNEFGINPRTDNPLKNVEEYPIIGENNQSEGEIINITSLDDILAQFHDDEHVDIKNKIKEIIQISNSENGQISDIFNSARSQFNICAWYCPIHYYSYDWGIYIKEDCIKNTMLDIVRLVNWKKISKKINYFNQLKLSA